MQISIWKLCNRFAIASTEKHKKYSKNKIISLVFSLSTNGRIHFASLVCRLVLHVLPIAKLSATARIRNGVSLWPERNAANWLFYGLRLTNMAFVLFPCCTTVHILPIWHNNRIASRGLNGVHKEDWSENHSSSIRPLHLGTFESDIIGILLSYVPPDSYTHAIVDTFSWSFFFRARHSIVMASLPINIVVCRRQDVKAYMLKWHAMNFRFQPNQTAAKRYV